MRMHFPGRLMLSAFIGVSTVSIAVAQAGPNEQAIRRRRAASNAAIARHDTGGIGDILADDVVVVTSNSVHAIGRATNLQRFSDQFRTRPDVVYERTPQQVHVYAPWGMASEFGRWTGSWTDTDGKIRIGGIYFAKWRLRNGAWLVESETYVPDRCTGGSYCRTAP
jgi:ketosteroid isomerase-like protein